MFSAFQEWRKTGREKKIWQAFEREVQKNLELCYVMSQLGQKKFFLLESWQAIKDSASLPHNEPFLDYAGFLAEYNHLFQQAKDYEAWYSSDLERMSQENAKILHDKVEAVEEKFQEAQGAIHRTVQELKDLPLKGNLHANICCASRRGRG
jgi:hypothetical protein